MSFHVALPASRRRSRAVKISKYALTSIAADCSVSKEIQKFQMGTIKNMGLFSKVINLSLSLSLSLSIAIL